MDYDFSLENTLRELTEPDSRRPDESVIYGGMFALHGDGSGLFLACLKL